MTLNSDAAAARTANPPTDAPGGPAELRQDVPGVGPSLVPTALGGTFDRVDTLVRSLRPVFQRDVATGMALVAAPLTAALHVWCAGSPHQQLTLAERILKGGSIALSRGGHAVGEAFAADGLRVNRIDGGYLLNGARTRAHVTREAAALLLYATVAESSATAAPGGATVLLADLDRVPRDRVRLRPPAGVRLTGCLLPSDAVVGEPGRGAQLFLRTLQVTGSTVPALLLGAADNCLRLTLRRLARQPGRAVRRMGPQDVSRVVAGAFLDLTAADCLAMTATRALSALPGEAGLLSAVVSCVVPMLIEDVLQDVSPLLGVRALWQDGDEPLFARQVREMRAIGPELPSAFTGRAVVLSQLPFLARHAWFNGARAAACLFATGDDLPGFAWERLAPFSRSDGLAATLTAAGGRAGAAVVGRDELARLIAGFRTEFDRVRQHFAALPLGDASLTADPRNLAMADRYMLVLTAAACLGRYEEAVRTGQGLFADPVWITGALHRLGCRLGLAAATALRAAEHGRILEEALRHCADGDDAGVYRTFPAA